MKTKHGRGSRELFGTVAILATALAPRAAGQVTIRASVSSNGTQANGDNAYYHPAISADGRYVAFDSVATNLVPGDTNDTRDVFVRDRQTGATECVSVDPGGVVGNNGSGYNGVSISADGRYVAFVSAATTLVTGDTNSIPDVFVRDRQTGTTERVSVASGGAQANGDSGYMGPVLSADGRYVVFGSYASNLVPGDSNGHHDIFVRDRQAGTTERVSVASGGAQANADCGPNPGLSISSDGRWVAFSGFATNLVPGDTNGTGDVFVRDRLAGTTEIVSIATGGGQGNGMSFLPSISGDGRYVAFDSDAFNLVPNDTNGSYDVFVHDRLSGTTERASVDSAGVQGNSDSNTTDSCVSTDGRYVAFVSMASNLVPGDTNFSPDVFIRDRLNGTTARVSLDSVGAEGNDDSGGSGTPMSPDGRFVAFVSNATNLVPGDTGGHWDVFVRDTDHPGYASVCEAGVAGVIACPCANPPAGAGRGCDNSSATGGASLAASGGAYLSSDSLAFATSGEKPVATSVVLQGTAFAPAGFVYGQGVRCVAGALKRLYTKTASGGAITAPNLAGGDLTVHARSAALGAPIPAGSTRWYLVYYRDPSVLGGCPASSTFNCTQGRAVTWGP